MLQQIIRKTVEEVLLGESSVEEPKQPYSMIGELVMVRTYSAGVHFGTLVSKNEQNVFLKDAHRVHYWAKACSLSQLAMEGDKDINNARISMAVELIELDQAIEVIKMPRSTFKQLTSKIWKK